MFENWQGTIEINGIVYDSISSVDTSSLKGSLNIVLTPKKKEESSFAIEIPDEEFKITVKSYMTRKSSPEFNFMEKWNDNIPMPLRTMVGRKIKETPGMIFMELHGDITQEITQTCMKCGRPITNPISQYFGLGPECGHHNYVNPFDTEEELRKHVMDYREKLRTIKWKGWIPKSACLEIAELKED